MFAQPLGAERPLGIGNLDQDRLDLLGALAASRWQVFRYVRFPNALPFIFAGLN
ncbi:ABC transporter permease subunit, partial [Klebsiella pneumoniae]|uniref:ABC transporter permease subunit n=1 Tax=Klebsiella pneumoniae TaxID=573 RepID=UPI001D0EA856